MNTVPLNVTELREQCRRAQEILDSHAASDKQRQAARLTLAKQGK